MSTFIFPSRVRQRLTRSWIDFFFHIFISDLVRISFKSNLNPLTDEKNKTLGNVIRFKHANWWFKLKKVTFIIRYTYQFFFHKEIFVCLLFLCFLSYTLFRQLSCLVHCVPCVIGYAKIWRDKPYKWLKSSLLTLVNTPSPSFLVFRQFLFSRANIVTLFHPSLPFRYKSSFLLKRKFK